MCKVSDLNSLSFFEIQGLKLKNKKKHWKNGLLAISPMLVAQGMDEVLAHYACIFEHSDLHFHFQ